LQLIQPPLSWKEGPSTHLSQSHGVCSVFQGATTSAGSIE